MSSGRVFLCSSHSSPYAVQPFCNALGLLFQRTVFQTIRSDFRKSVSLDPPSAGIAFFGHLRILTRTAIFVGHSTDHEFCEEIDVFFGHGNTNECAETGDDWNSHLVNRKVAGAVMTERMTLFTTFEFILLRKIVFLFPYPEILSSKPARIVLLVATCLGSYVFGLIHTNEWILIVEALRNDCEQVCYHPCLNVGGVLSNAFS